ncbi:MAG TPA: hypothetical protein VFG84_01205 [Gemmatimonadaceae bacterium]|nr:hypothetical protein [Gemmatimonadaceae bacterium]
MPAITIREFCEALYCALTSVDAFSVAPDGSIAFVAHATSDGTRSRHSVHFSDVRHLSVQHSASTDLGAAEDRLELSVIEVERLPSGWRVWFNPWYLHEIEFQCNRISLDGADVSGTGKWLQDDIPSRRTV